MYRFGKHVNQHIEDDDERTKVQELMDIKCRYILDYEDLDVICGKP